MTTENPIDLRDLIGRDLNHSGMQTIKFLSLLWGKYPSLVGLDCLKMELDCSLNGVYSVAEDARFYLDDEKHPLRDKVEILKMNTVGYRLALKEEK